MARPLHALIRRLFKAAGPPGEGAPTDGELLGRWVRGGDEAAFELLLWRHGPMVLAACRRLLRDGHLAEDAFQATWLVLLRRAGAVRRPEALPAWLHRVACRVALRARAAVARRACREGPLIEAPAPVGFDEASWREVRAVLDEEIDALPLLQRQAVVLCCLQGRTQAEAARELGCPQGTLSAWLARARGRLRVRLARRGVTLGGVGWALGLADLARADVPRAFVCSLVTAARAVAATGAVPAGLIPGEAAVFAEEVLRAMRMTKFQLVLATLAVGVGLTTGLLAYQGQAQAPAAPTPQGGSSAAPLPAVSAGGGTGSPALAPPAQAGGETTPVPAAGGGSGTGGALPPPARAAAWPRWEYKALARADIEALGRKGDVMYRLTVGLNQLGAQGWELVAIEAGTTGGTAQAVSPSTYVFRRAPAGAMMRPPALPAVPGSEPAPVPAR
jgi:RNA polymerase sigma factor (sigma-70 family)